jgi:hypothetical protein
MREPGASYGHAGHTRTPGMLIDAGYWSAVAIGHVVETADL